MKTLIFAGTTEGREILEAFSRAGIPAAGCVATEYGALILGDLPGIAVQTGRMNGDEILRFIKEGCFGSVIDATHPFASEASRNISYAARLAGIEYFRVIREGAGSALGENASKKSDSPAVLHAKNTAQAAEMLDHIPGRILLTTGSRDLVLFSGVKDAAARMWVRILPDSTSLKAALEAGFPGSRIFCMQGPFSKNFNKALIQEYGFSCIVTKDSGQTGGTDEKLAAARECAITSVVIARAFEEKGYSASEILRHFGIESAFENTNTPIKDTSEEASGEIEEKKDHLPLYWSMKGKKILVFGAGRIATRRIEKLSRFQCAITVIAPSVSDTVQEIASRTDSVRILHRHYREGDLSGYDIVFAATDDKTVNLTICGEAKRLSIPVNVASDRTVSDFYFPAIIHKDSLTAALASESEDHYRTSRTARELERFLGKDR